MRRLVEFLTKIEKKFAWGFAGVLLGVAALVFSYYAFVYEKKVTITFDVQNEANVLDIHKPLPGLTVSFRGEDIEESSQNIRIVTVTVENKGQVDVLQSFYDQNERWGIRVDNGRLIDVRVINSNSEYLATNLSPQLVGERIIEFSKVIFERSKYVTLEILIIHSKDQSPELTPFGKIAGIDRFEQIRSSLTRDKPTLVSRLFSGSLPIQVLRGILYFVTGVALLVIPLVLRTKLVQHRVKRRKARRRREVERLLGIRLPHEKPTERMLANVYVDSGLDGLKELLWILEDSGILLYQVRQNELMQEFENRKSEMQDLVPNESYILVNHSADLSELRMRIAFEDDINETGKTISLKRYPCGPVLYMSPLIADLMKVSVVTREGDDRVAVAPDFKQLLERLVRHLESGTNQ